MSDTSPRAEARFRELLMQRSGEARLKMGCDLFDSSRAIVRASIRADPSATGDEPVRLFLRTYGAELTPAQVERFIARRRAQELAGEGA